MITEEQKHFDAFSAVFQFTSMLSSNSHQDFLEILFLSQIWAFCTECAPQQKRTAPVMIGVVVVT